MRVRKWTLGWVLTVAIASLGALHMDAQDSQRELERFEWGQRLGDCLVKGCAVFIGTIQSIGAVQKEAGEPDPQRAVMTRTVDMKVDQWLHGQRTGDTVRLLSAAPPAFSKTALGPWVPWEGITLGIGGQLLIVRWAKDAPRSTWLGVPEDVAIVSSDTSLFAPARAAIDQHHRFERDPGEVARIPQLLRDKEDPLIRGCMLTYLIDGEGVHNVDNAAVVLNRLLGHESVPRPGRAAIADWLAENFDRLGAATRKGTTEALVASATADDANVASPAVSAVVRLVDLQMLNVKPFLDPARQRKIVEHYRAFQAQHKGQPGHPEFESQLGIR
jgi:hypothetical protein